VLDTSFRARPALPKDGVTVAKEIELEDKVRETWAAKMVREVASKADDADGDGTTTATVCRGIVREGPSRCRG